MTPIQRWQVALIATGVILLLVAGGALLSEVPPNRYPGIAVWLLGALVIHDGIGAIAVAAASILLRRVTRIPFAVVVIVRSAAAVAVIVTVVVLPEIVKKTVGTANPSILPLDYAANLLAFYAALAVVTAAVSGAYLLVARVRRDREAAGRTE